MSITYELDLGAPTTPTAVVATMLEIAGSDGLITEHEGTIGSLRGGGWFHADVAEYDPPDPVENQFGFAPMVEVVFGVDKSTDFESQVTDILRLATGVLNRTPGDAILHYQYSEVWLLRRGGRLTVNDSLWKPEQLTLLPQPYDFEQLHFS